jgi:hypothetical protein
MSLRGTTQMRLLAIGALFALMSQLLVPTGAAHRTEPQQPVSRVELAPLPNFDIRSLRSRSHDPARVQGKKRELEAQPDMPADLVFDWNDELDLPNRLLSFKRR